MDVFGTIANAIHFATEILDYVKSVRAAESDRDALLAETSNLLLLLSMLGDQVRKSRSRLEHEDILALLDSPLRQCTERLCELEKKLGRGKKSNKWTWPFKTNDLKDDFGAIERLKSAIRMILSMDTLSVISPAFD